MSAFVLEDGVVYHTYSTYARGLDGLWGMYQWLDRAPKGRNETGVWWRRHDEYEQRLSWTAHDAVRSTSCGERRMPEAATRRPRRSRLAMPRGRADLRTHGAADRCSWWRPPECSARPRKMRHR